MKKVEFKRLEGFESVFIDNEFLGKASKHIRNNKIGKALKVLQDNNVEEILNDFIKNKPDEKTLDEVEAIIKILKTGYENGKEIIKDKLYDKVLDKFKKHRDEPIQAHVLVNRVEVNTTHDFPNLRGTLDKARYMLDSDIPEDDQDAMSVQKFISKCFSALTQGESLKVRLSVKYDGGSIIMTVVNGIIKLAITRGDESEGADLTHLFSDVVYNKAKGKIKDSVGLKSEVVMTKEDFEEYCNVKGRQYSNLRSAVTSIITASEGAKYSKYLTIVPLYAETSDGVSFSPEELNGFFNDGVNYEYLEFSGDNKKAVMDVISHFISEVSMKRDSYNFAIDGVVIDILNDSIRNQFGRRKGINKYQIAYKFPASENYTIVTDVKFTVGRTGKITPMVYYAPVYFNGTKHNHSTLSSKDRFDNLALKIGDKIIVTYNNDVMPYVDINDTCEQYNAHNKNKIAEYPKTCKCGHKLVDRGADMFCENINCDNKLIPRISYFCSVMGIKDVSIGTIAALYGAGLLSNCASLFTLDRNAFLQIPGMGDKKAKKLFDQLNKLKTTEISEAKLCEALGVSGKDTCESILSHITLKELNKSLDKIYDLDIEGVKDKKKKKFLDSLESVLNTGEMMLMLNNMNVVEFKSDKKKEYKVTVCFSGFRDSELESILNKSGIGVVDKLKGVSALIVKSKDSDSGKIKKAKNKEIEIIEKGELLNNPGLIELIKGEC